MDQPRADKKDEINNKSVVSPNDESSKKKKKGSKSKKDDKLKSKSKTDKGKSESSTNINHSKTNTNKIVLPRFDVNNMATMNKNIFSVHSGVQKSNVQAMKCDS